MQAIAIDWSGRERGAAETIWLARVRDGALVELENGRDREEVVAAAIAAAEAEPRTAVGLDFAFGFPAWYAEQRGWSTGREIWGAMRDEAETLLAACEPPFWGRPGRPAQTLGPGLRETDLRAPVTPKSVFQIGGSGAVGTGSLRGMRHSRRPRGGGARDLALRRPGPAGGGRDLPPAAHPPRRGRAGGEEPPP